MASCATFMFEHVYLGPVATREHAKIHARGQRRCLITTALIRTRSRPRSRPVSWPRRVTDYVAGMTDRYCIKRFEQLSVPVAFAP